MSAPKGTVRILVNFLIALCGIGFVIAGVVSAWTHWPHDYRDFLFVSIALCHFLLALASMRFRE